MSSADPVSPEGGPGVNDAAVQTLSRVPGRHRTRRWADSIESRPPWVYGRSSARGHRGAKRALRGLACCWRQETMKGTQIKYGPEILELQDVERPQVGDG